MYSKLSVRRTFFNLKIQRGKMFESLQIHSHGIKIVYFGKFSSSGLIPPYTEFIVLTHEFSEREKLLNNKLFNENIFNCKNYVIYKTFKTIFVCIILIFLINILMFM